MLRRPVPSVSQTDRRDAHDKDMVHAARRRSRGIAFGRADLCGFQERRNFLKYRRRDY